MDRTPTREKLRSRPWRAAGLAVLLCGTAVAAATGVYVWYDKDGRPHYSDRPQPGTEKIEVMPAQSYQAPPSATGTTRTVPTTAASSAAAPGPACRIISPVQDEAILNQPSVTVTAVGPPRATPKLSIGGRVIESTDGNPVFVVTPIPRGTYTIVVNFEGGSLGAGCQTAPVTFHVRQPSVIKPAAAPKPKPKA